MLILAASNIERLIRPLFYMTAKAIGPVQPKSLRPAGFWHAQTADLNSAWPAPSGSPSCFRLQPPLRRLCVRDGDVGLNYINHHICQSFTNFPVMPCCKKSQRLPSKSLQDGRNPASNTDESYLEEPVREMDFLGRAPGSPSSDQTYICFRLTG